MYVYGKNVAKELLNNHKKIKKVYLYRDFNDQDIVSALQKNNIEIIYQDKRQLDKLENGNHQGIILSIADYEYCSLDELTNINDSFVVMLDHLEDPHNLGAIIRTCEAAGVNGIIIPKDRSVEVNSTVMKVSAGALENMKVVQVTNLVQAMKVLKQNGFWIVGTDMDGQDYHSIDYKGKLCLVIGSEGFGISNLVKQNCDFVAKLPMYGKINSLNASVAAGIFIYEAISKRR
jgi:23S rRNA (guanosine2251-2'-O)-methyltransferase